MRNLMVALAMVAVFAIAAAGSTAPTQQKANDCPAQCIGSCGGCDAACK